MQYLDYLNFLLINITFKIVTYSILLWNVTQLSTVTQISLLLDIIALLKIRHETLTSDYIRVTNAKLFTRYTDFFLLHIDRCATKKKPINKTTDPSWWAINIFTCLVRLLRRRIVFSKERPTTGLEKLDSGPSPGEYVPTRSVFSFLWHVNALPTTGEISSEGRGIHQTFPTDVSARTPADVYASLSTFFARVFFFSPLPLPFFFLVSRFFHWKENSNNVETGWNNRNRGAGTARSRDNS